MSRIPLNDNAHCDHGQRWLKLYSAESPPGEGPAGPIVVVNDASDRLYGGVHAPRKPCLPPFQAWLGRGVLGCNWAPRERC